MLAKHDGTTLRKTFGRRVIRPALTVSLIVLAFHLLAVGVVFTAASGWDDACRELFEESQQERLSHPSTMTERSYYVDPGYTCEYQVGGDTLVLRRDLTSARNLVMAITAGAALAVSGAGLAFSSSRPT